MKANLYTNLVFVSFFLTVMLCAFPGQAQIKLEDFPKEHNIELIKGKKRQLVLMPPGENTVKVNTMEVGEQYLVVFNIADHDSPCNPQYRLVCGSLDTVLNSKEIRFLAKSTTATLYVNTGCPADYATRLALNISFMRDGGLIDVTKNTKPKPESVTVSSGGSASYLITDIFIGGGCFEVSNVSTIGKAVQLGEFSGGGSSIQIETGVIIASGQAVTASGPNVGESSGSSVGGGGDGDLNTLANGSVFDAGGIQFDFKPTVNLVKFNYVFGSDEYNEYTCSSFNDVFGFFISGAGIGGNKNIALIPGTNTPVKINNVNLGVVGSNGSMANCTPPNGSLAYSGFFVNNPVGSPDVEYDGFTTVFTAEQVVIPCSTYHIKFAVGDVGDGVYDSGVFLEANSFSAGGNASGTVIVPSSGTNVVYEGCADGYVEFCRTSSNGNDQDLVLSFTIEPTSTATPGVDYAPFSSPIVIPAGEDCVELPITVFKDAITEGTESIKLKLSTPCSCESPFIEILIKDSPPLVLTANDVTICEEEGGADISVTATGGVGDYTYLWNNGATDPSIFVGTSTSQTYTVTVTDECGNSAQKDVKVIVIPSPEATIEGYGTVCYQQAGTVNLTVKFTGPGPWTIIYAINGVPQPPISNITQNPYILKGSEAGFYTIEQVYGDFGCEGVGMGEGQIDEVKVEMFVDIENPSCFGVQDGKITVDPYGGEENYYIKWSNGVEGFDYIDLLAAGSYKVTVTDANGCKTVQTINVVQPPELKVTAVIQNVKDCKNPFGGGIDLTVTGGTLPYDFNWDNGLPPDEDQSNLKSGIYIVTVTDANGCYGIYTYLITANDAPKVTAQTIKNVNCKDLNAGQIQLNVTGGQGPYTYLWNNQATTKDISGLTFGDYAVTVTDAAGCETYATSSVSADTVKPVVVTGPDLLLPCSVLQLTLDASATPMPNGFTAQWTTANGNIVSGANSLKAIVDAPGAYTLTITNGNNGCSNSKTVIVDPDLAKPNVFVNPPVILTCDLTQLTLDGSASSQGSNYQVSWTTAGGNIVSNPSGNYAIDINAPGKYTLKLINTTNGCDNSFTVDVKQDIDKPLADAGNTVLLTCKETDLTLNGNGSSTGADFIYDWTTKNGFIVTGKTGLTPTVNQPGWYYILVKDKTNGCTNLDSVLVNQDIVKPIAAAASPELLTCAVSVVPVSATGSSTGSTFSYDWSTVSGSIQGTNNGFTVNATSIGSYTVTVTNSTNGCTQTATVVVNEDKEKPVAKAGTDLILNCQQTTQLLDGSGSSVGPEFTYLWTTLDGNIISGANTLNPTIDQAGTYTLTVTSSKNGCSSSDDVKISLSEDFPVAVVVDPEVITCVKLSVLINGLGSSTGPEFTYQWSTTTGNIVAGANSSTPEVDKAGVYLFTITNVANGCVTNKNVTVKEDKVKPKAVAGPDFEAGCFDVPEALDGTASSGKGTLTYNWTTTNGNIVSGENTATPLIQKAGIYSLLITDNSNGCTATDNIEVTSNALEDVTFTLKIPSCFGEYGTAQIVNVKGGLPPYKYSINGGQSYTGNAVFNKLNPGLYNLLVKDGYECIIARSFEIPAKTDIQVLVEPKVELYLGESYTLKAQVNIPKNLIAKVEWFSKDGLERPDSLVTKVNVLQTTEYIVRVTDISGCTGQARVLVVIADPEIYVPNAFSPYDLNGNNDLAMVFGRPSGIKKITKFQIFNRWGESMYESSDFLPNDPNHGWNGLHRGKKLDPAVFVWWLEVEYINGKKKVYKGDINLLR